MFVPDQLRRKYESLPAWAGRDGRVLKRRSRDSPDVLLVTLRGQHYFGLAS